MGIGRGISLSKSMIKYGLFCHKKLFTFDNHYVMMYVARDGISHGLFYSFVGKSPVFSMFSPAVQAFFV